MIAGKSVLAIIPARGGSKGVPRKNVKMLGGKPLIAWTIEAARASKYIDRLIVTSEDAEIMDAARQFGCEVPFVRPAELAQDQSSGMDVVRHAVAQWPGYHYTVELQPTSPLRHTEDIDACIEACDGADLDACVSVTPATKPPQWMYLTNAEGLLNPLLGEYDVERRRQDLKSPLVLNGAVYVVRTARLMAGHSFLDGRVAGYEMPAERSFDIDTPLDWQMVSCLVEKRAVPL